MKLRNLYTKPSFNFLAGQSYIIFLYVLALSFTMFVLALLPQFGTRMAFENYICLLGGGFPCLILYSFILVSVLIHFNNTQIFCSKLFQILHVLIPGFVFLITTAPYAYNRDIITSAGMGIVFLLYFSTFITSILFTSFSLIPYLIIRYRENKYNHVVENPPFKNRNFNIVLLISIGFYLLTILSCFVIILLLIIS